MIGGDSSYDSSGHEHGGPADGAPQPPPAPQSRESAVPESPPAVPAADSAEKIEPDATYDSAENLEGVEAIERAVGAPPEPTGDERVDVALARFEELTEASVADHVEVFDDVQRRLQDVLASIDHEQPPEAASEDPPGAVARPRPGPGSWGG